MKNLLGVSAFFHDAAVSVIGDNKILFASSSERFSKIKNDKNLNQTLLSHAFSLGEVAQSYYYEIPFLKKLRNLYSFQLNDIFLNPSKQLDLCLNYTSHHESHAALAFYTSPYKSSAVVVIDAIGELETISIWKAENNNLTKLRSYYYPYSIGLLYSAFTKRLGFVPNKDEYIVMGMAGYGEPKFVENIFNDFVVNFKNCHKGIPENYLKSAKKEDIACSIQDVVKTLVLQVMKEAKELTREDNLCYGGGVALNCNVNSHIFSIFKNIFINSNPGDAGSSLGCILAHTKQKIKFSPYLGYNIKDKIDPKTVVKEILKNKVVGIAHGRAEFGPRALGNRSLLACPFSRGIKNRVNYIKGREQFRPLAPVVLEEFADELFYTNGKKYPFMQFTLKAKDKKIIPGAVHVDGTSRVQTVNRLQNPTLYDILFEYYKITGIPALINTSLNIKDQPLLNDEFDKKSFNSKYNLKVF